MLRKIFTLLTLSLLALGAYACDNASGGDGTTEVGQKPESNGKGGKADQWNWTNNPERFQIALEYSYDVLKAKTVGVAEQTPWPSDYWSYYQDSTNVRYHGEGELSPVEKYDAAFNGWVTNPELKPMDVYRDCKEGVITLDEPTTQYYEHLGPAANWQHQNKGNYHAHDGVDNDADGKTDECDGEDYDGIESWWGLCHAWVPAAILEPEPLRPVTVNGVTFTTSDIKALLITQHDRSSAHMLGGRCNAKEVERDEQGRVKAAECRDTNPGAFYVVITNLLGIHKRAFAEDRTAGYQVWNQPVLGYRITSEEELTEVKALEILGQDTTKKYTEVFDSPKAVAWRHVRMDTDYITESNNSVEGPLTENIRTYTRTDHYSFVLELDAGGKVVGGEWLKYNQESHPDFLWLPTQGHGGNPNINTAKVRELLTLSRQADEPEPTDEVELRSFADEPSTGIGIPDNDPVGVSRSITVDDDFEIASLKVSLDITHTYVGDLLVKLQKDDVTITLHDRTGAGADDLKKTFPVTDFNGASAKGEWKLTVEDKAARDEGKLVKWELIFGTGTTIEPAAARSFSASPATAIPDDDEAGIASAIEVTDEGTVRGLKVTVDITHTYIGDLVVVLTHGVTSETLHYQEGGSADNLKKTFAATAFAGAPLQGAWTLKVQDLAGQDVGTLNTWSIEAEVD